MRIAMIENGGHALVGCYLGCLRSLRGYQSCSNYRYIVASEGVEPSLQEPKSCVRPSHREAEPLHFRNVEAYAFSCVCACHIVVGEIILRTLCVLVEVWTLKNVSPHFIEFLPGFILCFVVTGFLREAMNDARVLAVIGLVYCVIHCELLIW